MVNCCCVKGCKNEAYPGSNISFHRFPKNEQRRLQWTAVVPGHVTKYSVICSAHFKAYDFRPEMTKRVLKPEAVPSIFPKECVNVPSNSHQMPITRGEKCSLLFSALTSSVKCTTMGPDRRCCVPGCESCADAVTLYEFPSERDMFTLWETTLASNNICVELQLDSQGRCQKYICCRHFEAKYIKPDGCRLYFSLPTLFTVDEMATGVPRRPIMINWEQYTTSEIGNMSETQTHKQIFTSGTKNVKREGYLLEREHNYCNPASSGNRLRVCPLQSASKDPQRLELLTNEIDLPAQVEDFDTPERECSLETESSTGNLPPPEPEFSWQRTDTIILADDETNRTKAWVDDPNDGVDLSMYNDDDAQQLPLAANDEKGDSKTEEDNRIHMDYSCNLCNKNISGFRYTCVQCADFDLCAACEAGGAHAAHYVLRVPRPTAHGEVEAVLECIRKNLFSEKGDAAANTGAGLSGDFLLDEIKSENEDTVLDENMSLPSMMERIEDDDEADPSFRETETRPSTAQSDSSSDESRARSELPVLRTRKRRFSDDPLRIDSAASGRGDDTSDARVLALQPVPDDIFQLHLQLDGTRRDTALTQRPTRSEPAGVKTYAVLTQTEDGRRIVKLRNIKVNVNRLTRKDIDAVIHKDTAKR